MDKKSKIILYAVVVVILVAGVVFFYNPQQTNSNNINSSNNSGTVSNSTKIPLTELVRHRFALNCWVAYQGKVYDLTLWLPKHPGSADAIAPYCGNSTAFEQAFSDQHGTTQVEKLTQEGIYKGELQ